jgi:hypothetical protein
VPGVMQRFEVRIFDDFLCQAGRIRTPKTAAKVSRRNIFDLGTNRRIWEKPVASELFKC